MAKKLKTKKTVEKKEIVVPQEVVKESDNSKVAIKLPKKLFLYGFIILLIVGGFYFVKSNLYVASVNGELIDRFSLIKELEKQGGKKVLDTVILKTLINQEAKKRNTKVSPQEIDAELKKIEVNVSSQGSTLDALLAQQGMTKEDLMGEIRLQLLVTKMVGSNVSVSQKEIDNYLEGQKSQSASDLGSTTLGLDRVKAESALKQQKIQVKIQAFVADLKAKAKINYFIKY
jgi:hypothetical protein